MFCIQVIDSILLTFIFSCRRMSPNNIKTARFTFCANNSRRLTLCSHCQNDYRTLFTNQFVQVTVNSPRGVSSTLKNYFTSTLLLLDLSYLGRSKHHGYSRSVSLVKLFVSRYPTRSDSRSFKPTALGFCFHPCIQ